MKKRQIALGMAALLFASGLAACGAKKEETKESAKESAKETEAKADAGEEKAEDLKADLKLFTYPIGQWGKSESVDALLENFNKKYPNVHVSVEYLDYTNGDDQVNTAIEGKAAPDLIMEGPERLVANWGAKGLMVDLKDIFEDEASQDIYKNVKDACASSDGKYYEYPLAMVAHCMAINKTMFEKADALQYIDAEKHTWTTENFFKAVEAINKSGQNDVLAVYCGGQGGDQGTRALVNNLYGGTFTNKEHTEYTADSPENIKALEELKKAKGVNFDPALVGGDEINLFRNGTLAMSLCWNSAQQNNKDNGEAGKTNNGDEIIPMMFPTDKGDPQLCGGIWGFGIFDNGDENKIKAAKAFIRFMCNDPEQAKLSVQTTGYFPTHEKMTGVYDGTEIADTMKMFTEQFMPHFGDYYQVVPGWAQARTEWWNMLQKIGQGGDVKTELATFQEKANAAAKS
ncbi:MAG: extracellular solute-binding protein [Lachnospiraceae bacterium]|nr:extracellular solute-binding protein [Lachnospiraceae bacterium]